MIKKILSKNKIQFITPASPIEDDRRTIKLNINYKHLGFGGQRGTNYNNETLKNAYVDHYPRRLLIASILILLLSSSDAFFTLLLINNGAVELNGLMDVLLKSSPTIFVLYKIMLTSLSTVFLVIHHNFVVLRLFKAEKILYVMAIGYMLLAAWELHLLTVF